MPEESEIEIRQVFEAEDFGPAQSESEHKAFMDECFAYHDELRKNGHIVGGEALQIARNVQGASRPDAWNQNRPGSVGWRPEGRGPAEL